MRGLQQYESRNSNIELLKIIAMCAIVICHVVAELPNSSYVEFDDYVFKYFVPSQSLSNVGLTIIHQLGFCGNTMFFICSSWFLINSTKTNYRKIVSILLDIEIISIIFLASYLLLSKGKMSLGLGFKMLFPHSFRLFWYLTCYVIIYMVHPVLNSVILSMPKRNHLIVSACSCFMFIVYNYFIQWYFGNVLISWIVLYSLVAYIKKYMTDFQQNRKANILFCIIGLVGIAAIPLGINVLGTYFEKFSQFSLQHFDDISRWNPFHILLCFGIFNLTNQRAKRNISIINYLASLSLLCFVIHSNRVVRCYIIPFIWEQLYLNGFYNNLILTSVCFGTLLFIVSLAIACIYNSTIRKITNKYLSPKICAGGGILFNRLIDKLMMLR